MVFKDKMMSMIVSPAKFHRDLENFYLSKYLITELQEFYTAKEQEAFKKGKSFESRNKTTCKRDWPICYLNLEKFKNYQEPQTILLTTHFILSNFHLGHFVGKLKNSHHETLAIKETHGAVNKLREEDLLIERQRHVCDCKDNELEKLKSEVRKRISKQLSNPDWLKSDPKPRPLKKQGSIEVNQVYENYMKGRRRDTLISHDDKSEYSQSQSSKPSHDITNYQNTRMIALT